MISSHVITTPHPRCNSAATLPKELEALSPSAHAARLRYCSYTVCSLYSARSGACAAATVHDLEYMSYSTRATVRVRATVQALYYTSYMVSRCYPIPLRPRLFWFLTPLPLLPLPSMAPASVLHTFLSAPFSVSYGTDVVCYQDCYQNCAYDRSRNGCAVRTPPRLPFSATSSPRPC